MRINVPGTEVVNRLEAVADEVDHAFTAEQFRIINLKPGNAPNLGENVGEVSFEVMPDGQGAGVPVVRGGGQQDHPVIRADTHALQGVDLCGKGVPEQHSLFGAYIDESGKKGRGGGLRASLLFDPPGQLPWRADAFCCASSDGTDNGLCHEIVLLSASGVLATYIVAFSGHHCG